MGTTDQKLLPRHLIISVLILPHGEVEEIVDLEYALIVLLSMRVRDQIAISVVYRLVARLLLGTLSVAGEVARTAGKLKSMKQSVHIASDDMDADMHIIRSNGIISNGNSYYRYCLMGENLLGDRSSINGCKLFIETSTNEHSSDLLSSSSNSVESGITK
jgi:hypothetical protein